MIKKQVQDIKDWNIKDKVKLIAGSIEENDDFSGFNYFEDLISYYFYNDKDSQIIKEKMDNLIKLFEEANSKGEEEFEKFQDMDFEEEIWNMI